jgi:hypothetical protein
MTKLVIASALVVALLALATGAFSGSDLPSAHRSASAQPADRP